MIEEISLGNSKDYCGGIGNIFNQRWMRLK